MIIGLAPPVRLVGRGIIAQAELHSVDKSSPNFANWWISP
jgi:hypothetical protein